MGSFVPFWTMFYLVQRNERLILKPRYVTKDLLLNIENELRYLVEGKYTPEYGYTITVSEIVELGKGIIDNNDASVHYTVSFHALVFAPKIDEIVMGRVKTIDQFVAAFCGPLEIVIPLNNVGENAGEYVYEEGENRLSSPNDTIATGSTVYIRLLSFTSSGHSVVAIGQLLRSSAHP